MSIESGERPFERKHDSYTISTDRTRFDLEVFHQFIAQAHWGQGRTRDTSDLAAANSLVFGVYSADDAMVGGARVVTDLATFGWVTDVFVLEPFQGQGLGRALTAAICDHPTLLGLRRLALVSNDPGDLYTRHGFTPVSSKVRWLELRGEN